MKKAGLVLLVIRSIVHAIALNMEYVITDCVAVNKAGQVPNVSFISVLNYVTLKDYVSQTANVNALKAFLGSPATILWYITERLKTVSLLVRQVGQADRAMKGLVLMIVSAMEFVKMETVCVRMEWKGNTAKRGAVRMTAMGKEGALMESVIVKKAGSLKTVV